MYCRLVSVEGETLKSRRFRIVSAVCAAGVAGGFVGFDASSLQAGTSRDSAFVSVTIQAAAQVGLVTKKPVTASSKGGIPTVPISTTSRVGFGSAGGNESTEEGSTGGGGTTGDAGASTGTSTTPEQAARSFAARGASPLSIGNGSAVAVAGAPNQTFNVILPSSASYADGGNVVSLSGFQHSAGATPALGSNGSGTFSIGAAVALTNMATANNTVAIILSGSLAKDIASRYGVDPKRSASLMDIFSCVVQGFIPYGAQVLLAASIAQISPLALVGSIYYCGLLGITAIISIVLGKPKG